LDYFLEKLKFEEDLRKAFQNLSLN